MSDVVSITSQGQLTIPKKILKDFGITGPAKAHIAKKGNTIIVEPKRDFWSLSASLASEVKLSESELTKAREAFSINWPEK